MSDSTLVGALTKVYGYHPEAGLSPAQPLSWGERLARAIYGEDSLGDYFKRRLGEREQATVEQAGYQAALKTAVNPWSVPIPGGNPEAATPMDAMLGVAASGGGIPGGIARSGQGGMPRAAASRPRPGQGQVPELGQGGSTRLGQEGPSVEPTPELLAALTDVMKTLPAERAPRRVRLEVNASNIEGEGGQSGASTEARNRIASLGSKGFKFMVRSPNGSMRPSNEDGGRYLNPGEEFGILGPTGYFDVQERAPFRR